MSNMSRRNFLKNAAVGALGMTVLGAVASAEGTTEEVLGQKAYLGGFDLVKNNDLVDPASIANNADTLVMKTVSAVPLSTYKTSPVAMPKITLNGVRSTTTDDELRLAKQMGINAVELSFTDDELDDFEAMKALVARVRNFEHGGFDILMCTNGKIQKCTSIHLALEDREYWIERTKTFMKNLAALQCDTMCIAWQPYGISRSGGTPVMTNGAGFSVSNVEAVLDKPLKGDRLYTQEEMWETYEYFIQAIMPTCKETGVRIAIHPNDPPVPYLDGIGSLIISMDDYRRAFEVAAKYGDDGEKKYIGAKLCLGCATEGGVNFSKNLLADLDWMIRSGHLFQIHFRNVTAPLDADYSGYFEECLAQDGYADMYALMKQLIKSGFNDSFFCDHSWSEKNHETQLITGTITKAVSNSWIMGLLYAARTQVGYELTGV